MAYQIAAGSAGWPVQFRFAVHDFCCVTAEHELRRLGRLDPSGAQSFGDWSDVSLFETVARTIMAGGFAYGFDRSGSRSSYLPVVLIASVPDSIAKLERLLGLQP